MIIALPIALLIGFIGMFIRNEMVYSYRIKLIAWAFHSDNTPYSWVEKSKVLDRISYTDMVFQFWRPLKGFAPKEHQAMKEYMR